MLGAASLVLARSSSLSAGYAFGDELCDVCNDREASGIFCGFNGMMHQKIGTGATGGWYMSIHTGTKWYCSDCDLDAECPGVDEPGDHEEIENFAATIKSGDINALRAKVLDHAQYVLINKELSMLALTNCKGVPTAQYKLTEKQIEAVS